MSLIFMHWSIYLRLDLWGYILRDLALTAQTLLPFRLTEYIDKLTFNNRSTKRLNAEYIRLIVFIQGKYGNEICNFRISEFVKWRVC